MSNAEKEFEVNRLRKLISSVSEIIPNICNDEDCKAIRYTYTNEQDYTQEILKLSNQYKIANSFLKFKYSIARLYEIISDEYQNNSWTFGKPMKGFSFNFISQICNIDYSLIQNRKHDLPLHSRVFYLIKNLDNPLLFQMYSTEENTILQSAYHSYILANSIYSNKYYFTDKSIYKDFDYLSDLTGLIIYYSINSIISYHNFLNAFSSSCIYDYVTKKEHSSKKYITDKIKNRVDVKIIFKDILSELEKESIDLMGIEAYKISCNLRNSLTHFDPLREIQIHETSQFYLQELERTKNVILKIARKLWIILYTDQKMPDYLSFLKDRILQESALDTIVNSRIYNIF